MRYSGMSTDAQQPVIQITKFFLAWRSRLLVLNLQYEDCSQHIVPYYRYVECPALWTGEVTMISCLC